MKTTSHSFALRGTIEKISANSGTYMMSACSENERHAAAIKYKFTHGGCERSDWSSDLKAGTLRQAIDGGTTRERLCRTQCVQCVEHLNCDKD